MEGAHSSLLLPLLRSPWHRSRAKREKSKSSYFYVKIRPMEAVEKCIKQINEKGWENPSKFHPALLFSNLAFKLFTVVNLRFQLSC